MSYMAEMVRAADCSPLLSSERDTLAEATCFEREVESFLVPISACDGADGGEVLGVGHTDSRSNAIVVSSARQPFQNVRFLDSSFFIGSRYKKNWVVPTSFLTVALLFLLIHGRQILRSSSRVA